jgi:peptidyl-prolyl cis-trans isomerase A (cyclophilin A)
MRRNILLRFALFGLSVSALNAQAPKAAVPATKAPATKAPATKAPATKAAATKAPATDAAATPAPDAPPAPVRENGLYATLYTSLGNITGKMYEKESPITVKNFMDLSLGRKEWTDPKTGTRTKRALYPGTICHRVIPGFMIQCGDPTGTGMGGTDVIPDEFDPSLAFDAPGKFGMANAGLGTGSSQFFITEAPTTHLTGKHTIFGQVVEGQDIVEKIARVARNADNKPNTPVTINKITFLRVGPGAPVNPPTTVTRKAGPPAAKKAGTATSTAPAAAKKTVTPAPAAAKKATPPPATKQ